MAPMYSLSPHGSYVFPESSTLDLTVPGSRQSMLKLSNTMLLIAYSVLVLIPFTLGGYNATVANLCPSDLFRQVAQKEAYYFSVAYEKCYFFATYESVEYETAKGLCEGYGGSLAMPKTINLNDFLISELQLLQDSDLKQAYWIGMHDKAAEGTMVWEDGTDVEDWGNFDRGVGSFFGAGEDCVALDPRDGKWHDYGCSNTGVLAQAGVPGVGKNEELPFICEFPVERNVLTKAFGSLQDFLDNFNDGF